MIKDDLVLVKCYQCGGETLGTVVKHSVRDSMTFLKMLIIIIIIIIMLQVSQIHRQRDQVNSSPIYIKYELEYYDYELTSTKDVVVP